MLAMASMTIAQNDGHQKFSQDSAPPEKR